MSDDERSEPGPAPRPPARPNPAGPHHPPGSYQGSRRRASPNGAPADYPGRRDVAQPEATPARPQDRPDPLTDPRYAQRPEPGRPGYGGGNAGYARGQYGSEGPEQGGGAYPGAYPGAGRGDRTAETGRYRGRRRNNGPAPEDHAGVAEGAAHYAEVPGGLPWSDSRGARDTLGGPGAPDERAGNNAGQYAGNNAGQYPGKNAGQYPDEYPGQDAGQYLGKNAGKDAEEYAADRFIPGLGGPRHRGEDGEVYEDDRFVPGLGGPRHRGEDGEVYEDDRFVPGLGGPRHRGEDGEVYEDDRFVPGLGGPRHRAGEVYEDDRFIPGLGGPRHRGEDGEVYEDDRFVPGLGGPRYPDADGEVYKDDSYDNGGGGDGPRGRSGRGPKRRRSRWIAPLIAVAVILTPVVIGGVYAFNLYQGKYHPADYAADGTGQAIVEVQTGQTATAVGERLVTLGVVASVRAFELAAEHSTNGRGLEPGFYRMHRQMKASLAFALLLNPSARVQIKIAIPEGWRLSRILATLSARSGIPLADYQKAVSDPAALGLPSYAGGNPEGYLFPATYEVQPNQTAATVLQAMVQRFDTEAASINFPQAAASVHLTPSQVIIVASLIQAEGGSTSYYPQIARVIYNRLAQNMALQLDSTVMYGLNTFGIIASDQQLESTSRYNTYKYKGLPPGPIDSPGNAAIQAALHPASGNDLYFVTVNPKTGLTEFTASQATFEQLRNELERNLGQG